MKKTAYLLPLLGVLNACVREAPADYISLNGDFASGVQNVASQPATEVVNTPITYIEPQPTQYTTIVPDEPVVKTYAPVSNNASNISTAHIDTKRLKPVHVNQHYVPKENRTSALNFYNQPPEAKKKQVSQFENRVKNSWGKSNVLLASSQRYVKYSDGYLSRAEVDFAKGVVRISTVAQNDPGQHLKRAIVVTLLTPTKPDEVDLYSDADINDFVGEPFLLGQVLDQDKQQVRWQWRANRFATYLMENNLQQEVRDGKASLFVEIPMVQNHTELRSYKYAHIVRAASQKYNIPEDLIYAIIRTESSFNPYAVSWANAYGLMQVVPKTAGRDVYKLVKHSSGMPDAKTLFDPAKNIDIGTAYFHILKTRYLKNVQNSTSQQYSMISAYNGGTGNVLKTFHSNRARAMDDINSLQPKDVYWALTQKNPNAESRHYLEKVTRFKKEFYQLETQGKL